MSGSVIRTSIQWRDFPKHPFVVFSFPINSKSIQGLGKSGRDEVILAHSGDITRLIPTNPPFLKGLNFNPHTQTFTFTFSLTLTHSRRKRAIRTRTTHTRTNRVVLFQQFFFRYVSLLEISSIWYARFYMIEYCYAREKTFKRRVWSISKRYVRSGLS